ncbi:CD2-associated protein isoform X2 [Hyla sarda]|uniref:CD2-associated protein isoform X2 n=1 Tax=Hyla sarda TaxID=327740 RepID=UPI0024C25C7D|nr:CD2-associated protein isoform X2 [Hyla sarda]
MGEYVVEYDYDAVHEDELTMRVGDVIKNVRRLDEEGWMEGEINGKRGAFPDNFVKEVKKDSEPKEENLPKREKSGNVASLVQRMSVIGIPGMGPPPPPPNKAVKKKSKKRQCKVLFEYIPQNEDELELKVGEVLEITEEVEEGWWSGTISGRSGLFPSNFVKELELSDDGESQESSEDPEPAAATVASPASPLLSPAINSEVPPLSVAQPKKVMGVGFGDIFKEGSVKLKTRMPNAEAEIKKPEKPSPTPAPPTKVARTISSDFSRTETDSKPKAKETCRALYNYDATNDDELSFKEGDIIHLISKDSGDPGWWKGELNGKEGVFPDNFAAIIQDSEKEKPKKPPPPVKSPVPKPELRLAEKRFTPPKPEERDEKPSLDPKPSKPAAPQVPPKKPILVNKSNSILKPACVPPKRPEKPAFSTPPSKPNGESPLSRPKSEPEPLSKTKMDLEQFLSRPKSVEVEPSAVKSPREHAPSELSFDDVVTTSENLSHPTASRPKMAGKRPPGRFNGLHSQKDLTEDLKVHHEEEEEIAKPLTPEIKKPSVTAASTPVFSPMSIVSKPIVAPLSPVVVDVKPKLDDVDGRRSDVDELRAQISELLTIVDALRKEHGNELDKIKKELEEERRLRSSLESEIDKLKKAVQLS